MRGMSQDGISRFLLSIWRICKIVPFLSDKATPRLTLQFRFYPPSKCRRPSATTSQKHYILSKRSLSTSNDYTTFVQLKTTTKIKCLKNLKIYYATACLIPFRYDAAMPSWRGAQAPAYTNGKHPYQA